MVTFNHKISINFSCLVHQHDRTVLSLLCLLELSENAIFRQVLLLRLQSIRRIKQAWLQSAYWTMSHAGVIHNTDLLRVAEPASYTWVDSFIRTSNRRILTWSRLLSSEYIYLTIFGIAFILSLTQDKQFEIFDSLKLLMIC